MSSATAIIFIICLLETIIHSPTFETEINSESFKVVEESYFFGSKIWTEYSQLLYVDDSDTLCSGSRDIIFPDTTTTSLYYRCQNGRKELYQCIEGFEFDNNTLRCSPRSVHGKMVDCFQQIDGFYPDYKTSCQEYFRCKNGIKIERLLCPPHESFSFHLQSCQLKSEVTCVKSNCEANNEDFYIYPGSKCQAYYYCRNGIRSDFVCPKGSIFNRQSKTCVESGICYEPVCIGRIDGRYADTTHDCSRSFYCKGGALEEVHNCPAGQKHDGYMCVSPPFKSCEKPEKTAAAFYFRANDECKILQDGTHVVPGSDCRSVRVCLRGKTTVAFECPRDQRFDGNACFPKSLVPCDDACSMKADGNYADEFTDCQGYYSCLNEKVSRRKHCPNDTAFNGYTCVSKYLVSCPKKSRSPTTRCLGLNDGFHPDYLNGCRNYFYCYNHEMVLQGSCSEGMIWSQKECVKRRDFLCEGPEELEECAGLSIGLYQNKTSGCTKYFYCNSGSGVKLSCPEGQLFNGYKCVNSDEYTCVSSNDCVNQPDGYRQDKSTGCRSYYYCSDGNKITYVCPDGLVFNGTICVSSQYYQCPFISSTDCIGKSDGYHPDKLSQCKKYFYCLKEEKLNTLTCGGKKIFDGQGCVLVKDPISVCLKNETNPCEHIRDGTHADPKSNCRKYFSCRNNTMLEEGWCPKGFAFDGNTCIKNFSCHSKTDICDEYSIGFYQDLVSNCRNYYFCIGRTKIWATCPNGTKFNGQICIDSNYYICPSAKS